MVTMERFGRLSVLGFCTIETMRTFGPRAMLRQVGGGGMRGGVFNEKVSFREKKYDVGVWCGGLLFIPHEGGSALDVQMAHGMFWI